MAGDGREACTYFTVHYTPKHGRWLNQAETKIGMFAAVFWASGEFPPVRRLDGKPAPGIFERGPRSQWVEVDDHTQSMRQDNSAQTGNESLIS